MEECKFKVGDKVSVKECKKNHGHPQFVGEIKQAFPGENGLIPYYRIDDQNAGHIWVVRQPEIEGIHVVFSGPTGEQETIVVKTDNQPRRVKALATNRDMLLSLLMAPTREGVTRFNLAVVDAYSLPADVQVEDVTYDTMRQLFLIEITSEEFPDVPIDQSIPIFDLPVDNWSVARVKDGDLIVSAEHADRTFFIEPAHFVATIADGQLKIVHDPDNWEKAIKGQWARKPDYQPDQATELIEIRKLLTTLVEQGAKAGDRQRTVDAEQSGTLEQIAKLMVREVHGTEEALAITRKIMGVPGPQSLSEIVKEACEMPIKAIIERDQKSVEIWNRQKGIIKPTEIIVSREDLEAIDKAARVYMEIMGSKTEYKFGLITEITTRLLSATPDESHRESA